MESVSVKMMVGVVLLAAVVVAAIGGYMVFKPPAQASGPITAAPVAGSARAATTATPVYAIDPNASKARFVVDEILRGAPKTVVGETNQVAGQITADLDDLDTAKVGTIMINARTLTTDADGRNRMLQNQILQTDQHEYITFTPKQLIGIPDSAAVGQQITFQMVGDLTIRGMTRETTFDVVMTPTTDEQLQGTASTSIRYADWGVSIPQVPSVAGVGEQVALQLEFVARTA
jgi:polyisoprenoid-binding protein YceI